MIKIDGSLVIRSQMSKYGEFKLGTLFCEIGTFTVKEKELEQFEVGKYQGEFVISQIALSDYRSNGRITTEIRAYIESMTLSSADSISQDEIEQIEAKEVDPIIEEMQQTGKVEAAPKSGVTATSQPAKTTSSKPDIQNLSDEELFKTLWPLGEAVQLDKTVNREVLRMQRARLNELGYAFALDQVWRLKNTSEATA